MNRTEKGKLVARIIRAIRELERRIDYEIDTKKINVLIRSRNELESKLSDIRELSGVDLRIRQFSSAYMYLGFDR
jgi:hypothetical protein